MIHYTPLQSIRIINECHTKEEVDKVTDRLYEHVKTYCHFDVHLIGQALKFKYKKLNTLEK